MLADLGIDGIQGDSDIAYAQAIQLLDLIGQEQTVGA